MYARTTLREEFEDITLRYIAEVAALHRKHGYDCSIKNWNIELTTKIRPNLRDVFPRPKRKEPWKMNKIQVEEKPIQWETEIQC